MPASRFPSPHAAASHALAALERYRSHLRKLAANWMDMELYRRIGEELDQIRQGCREVHELSRTWVELLIAHAELVQGVWQGSRAATPVTAADRQRLLQKLDGHVAALQDACTRIVTRPPER